MRRFLLLATDEPRGWRTTVVSTVVEPFSTQQCVTPARAARVPSSDGLEFVVSKRIPIG
jgi:hypothetical protein